MVAVVPRVSECMVDTRQEVGGWVGGHLLLPLFLPRGEAGGGSRMLDECRSAWWTPGSRRAVEEWASGWTCGPRKRGRHSTTPPDLPPATPRPTLHPRPHPRQVSAAATAAMLVACVTAGNRDLEPHIPALVSCVARPDEVPNVIAKLSATTFVQVRRLIKWARVSCIAC